MFSGGNLSATLLLTKWTQITQSFFDVLAYCAICGKSAFGHLAKRYKLVPLRSMLPPFAVANAIMGRYCEDRLKKQWRMCPSCYSCSTAANPYLPFLVYHRPEYTRMLLKEPVTQLQLLSLLDARMNVHKHYQGFVSGRMASYSLLENPLVSFGFPLDPLPFSNNLKTPLSENLRSNPILHCFKCMFELQKTSSLALVPSSIVEDILRHHIERGPLRPIESDLMGHTLALLSDERPLGGHSSTRTELCF
jgi:hypothetical protein